MERIWVLHGVNLNMFGKRDTRYYGNVTLEDINGEIAKLARKLRVKVEFFQSNHEGAMIEHIHHAHDENIDGVVINPGAWTHYSYAIRDALEILEIPIVEVHMSNIHARESFRQISVISPVVSCQICGLGLNSYLLGLIAVTSLIRKNPCSEIL